MFNVIRRALAIAACLTLAAATLARADRARVFLGGNGSDIVVVHANNLYKTSGDDRMEMLSPSIARPDVTAMTAGPDGVFTAVGRVLYVLDFDGSGQRELGKMKGGAVTALADLDGTLYAAGGDVIHQVSLKGEPAPTVYAKAPGDVRCMFAARDGVYVGVDRTLWRVKGDRRDKIVQAPSPILALSGGNRNLYYAYRIGDSVEISAPGATRRWVVRGLKSVDSLYYDAARNTVFYSWSDKKGPHYRDLPLTLPPT